MTCSSGQILSLVLELKTLYEVWFGSPTNYYKLRLFGYPTYAHIKKDKFELRARKFVFLEFTSGVKGYRLWCVDPKSSSFITNGDVTFDESAIFHKKKESNGVNVVMNKSTSKQVKLMVKASEIMQKYALVEPVEEVVEKV